MLPVERCEPTWAYQARAMPSRAAALRSIKVAAVQTDAAPHEVANIHDKTTSACRIRRFFQARFMEGVQKMTAEPPSRAVPSAILHDNHAGRETRDKTEADGRCSPGSGLGEGWLLLRFAVWPAGATRASTR
jgi:hypothetical protein